MCSFGVQLLLVYRLGLARENKFQKAKGPLKHSFAGLTTLAGSQCPWMEGKLLALVFKTLRD